MTVIEKLENVLYAIVGLAFLSVVFVPLLLLMLIMVPVGLAMLFCEVVFNVVVHNKTAVQTYTEWLSKSEGSKG